MDAPKRKSIPRSEPIPGSVASFTVRPPTPLSESLSRNTSTGLHESDSSVSASASASASASGPGSSNDPAPRRLRLRGSEREEKAKMKRGSPLARGAIISGPSDSVSTRKDGGVGVDSSDDGEDDEERDEPVTAFDKLSGALNERCDPFFLLRSRFNSPGVLTSL